MGAHSAQRSALFQDFAPGMFSLCLLQRRPSASTAHVLNQKYHKFAEGNEEKKNFHCFLDLSAPSHPLPYLIYFTWFMFVVFMPLSDFYIPRISLTPPPVTLSSSSLCLCSFLALFHLSVAFPLSLPLICVLSLPQSQIIPSLWNWKIAAGESKREIIMPD